MSVDPKAVEQTLAAARQKLLAARAAGGHWEGGLSSSALATATAVCALALLDRAHHAEQLAGLVRRGLAWLAGHQNADGGWGDTASSPSNVSTTTLCWAALGADEHLAEVHQSVTQPAEAWLKRRAGDLTASHLASAIGAVYGDDRTFSTPILTTCALVGRFGTGRSAWRSIPALPFELAACPHAWFRWLGLRVVSYALPALIAIGQARHRHRPTRNPLTRGLRFLTRGRTLRILESIQPESGGFLEAIPLTSFVVMSLASIGQWDHPVVERGRAFLAASARDDGSWPIDTNLATWVTTLSVNALAGGGVPAAYLSTDLRTGLRSAAGTRFPSAAGTRFPSRPHRGGNPLPRSMGRDSRHGGCEKGFSHQRPGCLSTDERAQLRTWLLDQQHRQEHPYTHAAPGGWAWTDLSGGVPDADDTSGALIALRHLKHCSRSSEASVDEPSAATCKKCRGLQPARRFDALTRRRVVSGNLAVTGEADRAAEENVRRAAAAGVRWLLDLQNRDGGIPTFCRGWGKLPFDRSSPDLTAHALRAWHTWREALAEDLRERIQPASRKAVRYLIRAQREDGSWVPLWFGNQQSPNQENPLYGTARVLRAGKIVSAEDRLAGAWSRAHRRGLDWVLSAQNADGGWGGAVSVPSSVEETALAVEALAGAAAGGPKTVIDSMERGCAWLIEHTAGGTRFDPTPIGLYFAKLWYSERLYPLIFTVAALERVGRLQTTA